MKILTKLWRDTAFIYVMFISLGSMYFVLTREQDNTDWVVFNKAALTFAVIISLFFKAYKMWLKTGETNLKLLKKENDAFSKSIDSEDK